MMFQGKFPSPRARARTRVPARARARACARARARVYARARARARTRARARAHNLLRKSKNDQNRNRDNTVVRGLGGVGDHGLDRDGCEKGVKKGVKNRVFDPFLDPLSVRNMQDYGAIFWVKNRFFQKKNRIKPGQKPGFLPIFPFETGFLTPFLGSF